MSEDVYGIDKDHAHPRAIELIPDAFFWNCADELAPFGSDEGDTALSEYREWRKRNPTSSIVNCLMWTIESVGEMSFSEYNADLADKELVHAQLEDEEFDFDQNVNTLDISVIATGFAQLADEGKIEHEAKPIIRLALDRQLIVNTITNFDKTVSERYHHHLTRLIETLDKA